MTPAAKKGLMDGGAVFVGGCISMAISPAHTAAQWAVSGILVTLVSLLVGARSAGAAS